MGVFQKQGGLNIRYILSYDIGFVAKIGKFKKCLKWLYTTFVAIIYHYNPFLVEKHTKKSKIVILEIFHR